MIEVPPRTASGLCDCLKKMLQNKNITLENMVGFTLDTPNVMAAEH